MTWIPSPQALRCFVGIAREGTVSAAAERLHLSQPAVSLQLKGLEDLSGVKLFVREAHGLALTEEGRKLLPQAEAVMRALGEFVSAAAALHQPVRHILRLGTILDPAFIRLGSFLSAFVSAAPDVETQLRHGMSDVALADVLKGELDAGFYLDSPRNLPTCGDPGRGRLRVRPLHRFNYRVAAPPSWRAKVMGKGWEELAQLPWLATPKASAHRRLLDDVFTPLRVSPLWVALTDEETSMLDLIRSGVGLSLVREMIALREEKAGNLALIDTVRVECVMSFICLEARAAEAPISKALVAIDEVWPPLPAS